MIAIGIGILLLLMAAIIAFTVGVILLIHDQFRKTLHGASTQTTPPPDDYPPSRA